MTTPPQAGPETSSRNSRVVVWVPVIVAVIAGAATVVAALVNRPQPPAAPSPTTPATAAASTTDVPAACVSLTVVGGSAAAVAPNPQASTHDVTLTSASYALDRDARPPTITVAGRIAGAVPPGQHLWVIQQPEVDTRDSTDEHHAGSGRFYPAAEIKPDAQGCWADTPQSIGYDEAVGITFRQLFVQVDDAASRDLTDREAWLANDGYAASDLGRLGVDTIAFFSVPTAR